MIPIFLTNPTTKTTFHLLVIILTTFLTNHTNAQICQQQQATSTTTKDDYSFCCCRTIEEKIKNENRTDLHVFYTLSGWTIWRNITGANETIFDKNKDLHCFTDSKISSANINMTTECHCTNTYDDLSRHRTNVQFTCPKPKIVIGKIVCFL